VEVQGKVDHYLVRVENALLNVGASMTERRTVGVALRQQIMEKLSLRMLAAGTAHPSLGDADAVLAELGPPESHLRDAMPVDSAAAIGRSNLVAAGGPARFSTTALVGALWAPFFPIMLAISSVQIQVGQGQQPPLWAAWLQFLLVPLGWSALFATTVLGLLALSQIQKSQGRLKGLSLALFDAMLYPLLMLDALVFWLCWQITAQLQANDAITPPIASLINQALPTVACVLGDYFLVARAWMAVQPKRGGRRI